MTLQFGKPERDAAGALVELALCEDLAATGDVTCQALIAVEAQARVNVVARVAGVLAGAPAARLVFERLDPSVDWHARADDGESLSAGTIVATVEGPLRSLLTGERTALNFLTHLSGVATLTRQFVESVAGTKAAIFDTRKTLPGWRQLEKYAVRAGGGTNHRFGLYDGCLIKDNHLAAWTGQPAHPSIAAAVRASRAELAKRSLAVPIEVEVDTFAQFADALEGEPNVVLLDNMDIATLRRCIALRDTTAPEVALEASGGVSLANVAAVAATGVDRISVGAITHSAPALDLAFDWP